MKDQVLSVEQMQKLKELGIDISKASMCYIFFESDGSKYTDIVVHDESCYEMACMNPIPTFTLQDMIELMPNNVKYEGKSYYLSIDKKFVGYIDDIYVEDCVLESEGNILENTFKVLVWLAEHKYI